MKSEKKRKKAKSVHTYVYVKTRKLIAEIRFDNMDNIAFLYAENGAEAVKKITAAPDSYDIIFMDVQMPEMDGYEAARVIRAFEKEGGEKDSREIPIVAMTANVFQEDIKKCLDAGMNDHVGKFLNFEEVLEKLRLHLPSRNPQHG
jgi:CheY-like chemotaxis protein